MKTRVIANGVHVFETNSNMSAVLGEVKYGEEIDVEAELEKLGKDLAYFEGFLAGVMKKLGNERFVSSAPAKVVETEHAKKRDAEAKIAAIKERLAALSK